MAQRKARQPRSPKVGDAVLIEGCHKNYRPTIRRIEEGVAYVSTRAHWATVPIPLLKCSLASDSPVRRGRRKL